MRHYTASQLRAHLSEAFDEVERSGAITVERHGRTFRIVPAPPPASRRRRKLAFDLVDDGLLDAGWTWEWLGPGRPMKLCAPRGRRGGA